MLLKSLPTGWNTGVLSQAAGNFVCPSLPRASKRGCMGGGRYLKAGLGHLWVVCRGLGGGSPVS